MFGPRLAFRAEENAVVFDRGLLDLPLQSSRAVRRMLPNRPSEEEVVRAVLTNMSDQLAYETPTLETSAGVLGLHPRTLERRLARWGVPFESLLDEFRRTRSLQLIQQGAHTLTDIAFLVGYADSAHFTRAFRRWTGRPPRDYVRGLRLGREFNAGTPSVDILHAFQLPLTTAEVDRNLHGAFRYFFSNGKITFQSFFTSTTVHPFALASSRPSRFFTGSGPSVTPVFPVRKAQDSIPLRPISQLLVAPAPLERFITLSREKLPGLWLGGNSLKVVRNCPTYSCAGTSMKTCSARQQHGHFPTAGSHPAGERTPALFKVAWPGFQARVCRRHNI